MPLRHSPPTTPVMDHITTPSNEGGSDPGSQKKRTDKGKSQNTPNLKRKYEDTDCSDIQKIVSEIRIQFSKFRSSQEQELSNLKTSVNSTIIDLTKSVEYMNQRYDDFLEKLSILETQRSEDLKYIKTLEEKIENMERRTRNTCVEIRNISKLQPREDKSYLMEIVTTLGASIGMTIKKTDLKDIYRIPSKKDQPQPLIVDFTSTIMKDEVISSCKKFNKNKARDEKLNSRHLNIKGPVAPIYISESLTNKSKKLFYLARDLAKTMGYLYCWTSNGVVYLRKEDNKPFIRIADEGDLHRLKATL